MTGEDHYTWDGRLLDEPEEGAEPEQSTDALTLIHALQRIVTAFGRWEELESVLQWTDPEMEAMIDLGEAINYGRELAELWGERQS